MLCRKVVIDNNSFRTEKNEVGPYVTQSPYISSSLIYRIYNRFVFYQEGTFYWRVKNPLGSETFYITPFVVVQSRVIPLRQL